MSKTAEEIEAKTLAEAQEGDHVLTVYHGSSTRHPPSYSCDRVQRATAKLLKVGPTEFRREDGKPRNRRIHRRLLEPTEENLRLCRECQDQRDTRRIAQEQAAEAGRIERTRRASTAAAALTYLMTAERLMAVLSEQVLNDVYDELKPKNLLREDE